MFGSNQRQHDAVSTLDRYVREGYKETYSQDVYWRRITAKEIRYVPQKYTSGHKFLNGPGIALVCEMILAICALIAAVKGIIAHEDNAMFGLYLTVMLGLFVMVFTGWALFDRNDRRITSDSLVTVGEVAEVRPVRRDPNSGKVVIADHIIALHGSRQLITIRDNPVVDIGNTVLIQKSKAMRYHLIQIPESAADYDVVGIDHCAELKSYDSSNKYDYSMYTHVAVPHAKKKYVTGSEYKEIPMRYRTFAPFGRGWVTWVWLAFTLITVAMVLYLVKLHSTHDDMFIPMTAGFVCEAGVWLFICSAAFRKEMPKETSVSIDCVVLRKGFNGANGMITAIIPEKQQFIDDIFASEYVYKNIPLNEPVRLYFGSPTSGAVYFAKR